MTARDPGWPRVLIRRSEEFVATLAAFGIILLPLSEVILRRLFSTGIAGQATFASQLTLLVGLVGAAIAARDGKLLALATGAMVPEGIWRTVTHAAAAIVGGVVSAILAIGGVGLVQFERDTRNVIAYGVPYWWFYLAFPFAFGLIAARLVRKSWPTWRGQLAMGAAVAVGAWYATRWDGWMTTTQWPWFAALALGALLGKPNFTLLGGAALNVGFGQGDNANQAIIGYCCIFARSSAGCPAARLWSRPCSVHSSRCSLAGPA